MMAKKKKYIYIYIDVSGQIIRELPQNPRNIQV